MAGVEGIATNAGEVLRGRVVLPEAPAGGGVVEGERGVTGNGGEEIGVGAGLDPAEVLDAEAGRVGLEPEDRGPEAEVEEGNAALAIGGGQEEVRGGGLRGEEVAREPVRGPPDGGDERREGGGRRNGGVVAVVGGGGGRGRHGKDGDELHGAGVDDGDGAAGRVGEEAGGAEVGGSEVVTAGWAREHAVPGVQSRGLRRRYRCRTRPRHCGSVYSIRLSLGFDPTEFVSELLLLLLIMTNSIYYYYNSPFSAQLRGQPARLCVWNLQILIFV